MKDLIEKYNGKCDITGAIGVIGDDKLIRRYETKSKPQKKDEMS